MAKAAAGGSKQKRKYKQYVKNLMKAK